MANLRGSPADRSRRLLASLSAALGCTPDDFFAAETPDGFAMTEELLTLWLSLPDSGARGRILDCARAVTAEERARRLM